MVAFKSTLQSPDPVAVEAFRQELDKAISDFYGYKPSQLAKPRTTEDLNAAAHQVFEPLRDRANRLGLVYADEVKASMKRLPIAT